MGRSVHQPSSTRNGIHQSVNWMLRSIGRPCANSDAHGISGTTLRMDQPESSSTLSSPSSSTCRADSMSTSTSRTLRSPASAAATWLSFVAERELIRAELEAVGERTVTAGRSCGRAVVLLAPRVCVVPSLFTC